MNDMPTWWLICSAAFFVLGAVVFVAILITLASLRKAVGEAVPAITRSIDRLEGATQKLESTVASAQKTVDHVGSRARGISDVIEAVALVSAQRIQSFATILTATSTVFKLFKMVKSTKAEKLTVDNKPAKRDNKASHRGVEQPGSSSGS